MYCPKCGTVNQDNNFKCTKCGEILHPSSPTIVIDSNDTLGGLIPRNGPALAAYYLGIFSIIPFLGIPMGIIAVILGIKGLRRAREHPEAKGKIHAWVGIITGGLFGLLYLLLIGFIVASSGRR